MGRICELHTTYFRGLHMKFAQGFGCSHWWQCMAAHTDGKAWLPTLRHVCAFLICKLMLNVRLLFSVCSLYTVKYELRMSWLWWVAEQAPSN